MLRQSFKMALKAIASKKVRSFLTMLGIIIGVFSLVSQVSLVSNLTQSTMDDMNNISGEITVYIQKDGGKPLQLSELEDLKKEKEVAEAFPITSTNLNITCDKKEEKAEIVGIMGNYADAKGLKLSQGRQIKNSDVKNHTNVVVVSNKAAMKVMGDSNCIGKSLKIGGIYYEIIGVLQPDEFEEYNPTNVYIPYSTLLRNTDTSKAINTFIVNPTSKEEHKTCKKKLSNMLKVRFPEKDAYNLQDMEESIEQANEMMSRLSLILGAIASISLLVGGIGIMNIMLVSVSERTKEIGIRKAIGASRGVIILQFMIESLVLCLVGCIIGVILSEIAFKIGNQYTPDSFKLSVTSGSVRLGVLASMIIGMVFGIYPAWKASSKKLIEALRYNG